MQENNAAVVAETENQKLPFNMSQDQIEARKVKAEEIRNLPASIVKLGEHIDKKTAESIVREFSPVTNANDGRTASVPISTVGKILGNKGFDTSRIIRNIPTLYETSVLAWSEPEIQRSGHKPHNNISGYHHYVNKFADSADEYYIRLTVTEGKTGRSGKNRKNILHAIAISNITIYKKGDDSQPDRLRYPEGAKSPPFVDKRLREFFESTLIR